MVCNCSRRSNWITEEEAEFLLGLRSCGNGERSHQGHEAHKLRHTGRFQEMFDLAEMRLNEAEMQSLIPWIFTVPNRGQALSSEPD